VLCLDKTTTGDGLIVALQILEIMCRTGSSLSELARGMRRFPQILLNVAIAEQVDLGKSAAVGAAVKAAESKLNGRGRIVLRPSGTEPVVRVMVEGEDEGLVRSLAETLAASVRAEFG